MVFCAEPNFSKIDVYNAPKLFVARHPISGKKVLDIGQQDVKKIVSRYGIAISVYTEINKEGVKVSGIRIDTAESTG
jgi:hypothetical protein